MTADEFLNNFGVFAEASGGMDRLREMILALAFQGRLVAPVATDEPAETLVQQIVQGRDGTAAEENNRHAAMPSSIPGAPAHWCWARLGQVAEVTGGVTKGRNLVGRNVASYPYLRVANVQRGFLDLSVMKEIEIPVEELGKYRLRRGDLLFTEGGDWDKLGRSAVWEEQLPTCLHQNHVFKARLLSPKLSPRWFSLFANSPGGQQYFANASKQTTNLASINITQLRNLPVPVPPAQEQIRILTKVDQLMALCDELEARQAKKRETGTQLTQSVLDSLTSAQGPEEFAKAWQRVVMHFEMLIDKTEHVGELRKTILNLAIQGRLSKQDTAGEPAAVLIKRVCDEREQLIRKGQMRRTDPVPQVGEDEQVFQVPDSWVWCRMGDVCIDSFYGPRFNKNEYSPDGVPTIRTTDMTEDGEIVLQAPPRVRVSSEKLDLYRLLRGDLIITRTGSIGTTAVFKGGYDAIPSAYLIRFRFSRLVEVDYIQIFLKSPFGQGLLQEEATRMAQPNISATAIRRMPLPLPPSAEQRQIVSVVQRFMALCDALESKLGDAEQGAQRLAEAMAAEMVA